MKRVILNIPDKEFDFFMKLVQKFKYKIYEPADYTIPEDVQQMVEERRTTAKSSDYISRTKSAEKIKKKYGF